MQPEPGEWIIPAPLRALLWWPLTAFLLTVLRPAHAGVTITGTGAILALLGTLGAAAARNRAAGAISSTGRQQAQYGRPRRACEDYPARGADPSMNILTCSATLQPTSNCAKRLTYQRFVSPQGAGSGF